MSTPASAITNRLLSMLWSFMHSARDMKLHDSFGVFVRIFSRHHADHLRRIGRIGCEDHPFSSTKKKRWLLRPTFKGKDGTFFHDKCLIIAVILGYFRNRADEQDYTFLQTRAAEGGQCKKRNEFLKSKIDQLAASHPHLKDGPYDLVHDIPVLAEFYGAQILVYSAVDYRKLIFLHPDPFDEERPLIMLLLSGDANHVDLISKPEIFFNNFGMGCFLCDAEACTYRKRGHLCNKNDTCYSCGKFVATGKEHISHYNKFLYCQEDEQGTICPNCQMFLRGAECQRYHKVSLCREKFKCWNCGRLECVQKEKKTTKELREAHQCDAPQKCWKCLCDKDTDHVCTLRSLRKQGGMDILAFAFFVPMNTNPDMCPECQQKDGAMCVMHATYHSQTQEENLAVLIREDPQNRQHFLTRVFSADDLDISVDAMGSVHLPYMPEDELDLATGPSGRFNTGRKRRQETMQWVKTLAAKVGTKTPAEQLLLFLLTQQSKSDRMTILVEDSFGMNLIFQVLHKLGLSPVGLPCSTGLMQIEVEQFKMRFLPRTSFLSGSLSDLAATHDLPQASFFPLRRNAKSYYSKTTPLILWSSFADFLDFWDPEELVSRKKEYFGRHETENYCFREQLVRYGVENVELLAKLCCRLLQHTLSMQEGAKRILLFTPPIMSMAGFSHYLFLSDVPEHTLYAVNHQYGRVVQSSTLEVEYGEWHRHARGNHVTSFVTNYSADTSPLLQMKGEGGKPDCIDETAGKAIFVSGCVSHGCPLPKKYCGTKKTERFKGKKTWTTRYEEHMGAIEKFEASHPQYKNNTLVVWECEWRHQKKKNANIRAFLDSGNLRPMERLNAREAFRGGVTEALKIESRPGFLVEMLDVVSMYPYVAASYPQPVGKPVVLIGNGLCQDRLTFKAEAYCYEDEALFGLLHVRVFPPDFGQAILPVKIKTSSEEKVYFTLCFRCAKFERSGLCKHSDQERSWVGTYTTLEVNKAKTMGYNFAIFEALHYSKKAFLYKKFVQRMAFNKIKFSGIPGHIEDREKFCDRLNNDMEFGDLGLELRPDEMVRNNGLRYLKC